MAAKIASETCEKLKDADICSLSHTKYLIQASRGRFAEVKSLTNKLSYDDIRPLHRYCQNGHHYMARTYFPTCGNPSPVKGETIFYIIKNNSCTEVDDLEYVSPYTKVYMLHQSCQGGSFYFANMAWFFIICSEDSTISRVDSLKDPHVRCTDTLPQDFQNGLCYFATDAYMYVVKTHTEFGLVYHRKNILTSVNGSLKGGFEAMVVSGSVAAFLCNQFQGTSGM